MHLKSIIETTVFFLIYCYRALFLWFQNASIFISFITVKQRVKLLDDRNEKQFIKPWTCVSKHVWVQGQSISRS